MAFLSKVGNILRQSATKHINPEFSASSPSIYQAIRCMSTSKLFIGGLSYSTDDQSLRDAFGNYGEVVEARVIMDHETGRSRGFGFITYTSSEEASSAIQALDGQDLHGRRVRVNYATDRARTGGFGGGGGYGGNFGGGGGGYNDGGSYGGGGGGGYNDGGSYGGGGGGGNYNNNYASGGGGGYGGGNTFDSVSGGGGNFGGSGGNFGVAGGVGGPGSGDNYATGATGGGYGASIGSGGMADAAGGINQGDPMEGNFRDDDDEPDYAKRA